MFRAFHLVAFAFALAFVWTACTDSTRPLSAKAGAQLDPRLIGTWRIHLSDTVLHPPPVQEHPAQITFDAHGLGAARDMHLHDGYPIMEPMRFFVTRTGKASYLNVRSDFAADESRRFLKAYIFCRYRISDDGRSANLWLIRQGLLKRAVIDSELKGKVFEGDTTLENVHLDDTGENILKFIESKPDEEVFWEAATMKKID